MALEDVLSKDQFSENELVEARDIAFEVDNKQMRRKTSKYLLADKYNYIIELLRASINSKPTKIKMSTAGGNFSIRHDGEGLTGEELDYLLTNIFMSESYNPDLSRYAGIARGVFSALEIDDVTEVVVETAKEGNGVKYMLSKDKETRRDTSLKNGVSITVKRGSWYSKPLRALALQGSVYSSERHMLRRMKELGIYAECPVMLNGRNIASNYHKPRNCFAHVIIDGPDLKGVLSYPKSSLEKDVHRLQDDYKVPIMFSKDGIGGNRVPLGDFKSKVIFSASHVLDLNLEGAVISPKLNYSMSGELQRDDSFFKIFKRVEAYSEKLMEKIIEKYNAEPDNESLRNVLLNYLSRYTFISSSTISSSTEPREAIAKKLRKMPIVDVYVPGRRYAAASLEDILKSINENHRFIYASNGCYTDNKVNDLVFLNTDEWAMRILSETLMKHSISEGYKTYRYSDLYNKPDFNKGIDVGANIVYGKLRRKQLRNDDYYFDESRADKIIAWSSGISVGGITGVVGYVTMDASMAYGAAIAAKVIGSLALGLGGFIGGTYLLAKATSYVGRSDKVRGYSTNLTESSKGIESYIFDEVFGRYVSPIACAAGRAAKSAAIIGLETVVGSSKFAYHRAIKPVATATAIGIGVVLGGGVLGIIKTAEWSGNKIGKGAAKFASSLDELIGERQFLGGTVSNYLREMKDRIQLKKNDVLLNKYRESIERETMANNLSRYIERIFEDNKDILSMIDPYITDKNRVLVVEEATLRHNPTILMPFIHPSTNPIGIGLYTQEIEKIFGKLSLGIPFFRNETSERRLFAINKSSSRMYKWARQLKQAEELHDEHSKQMLSFDILFEVLQIYEKIDRLKWGVEQNDNFVTYGSYNYGFGFRLNHTGVYTTPFCTAINFKNKELPVAEQVMDYQKDIIKQITNARKSALIDIYARKDEESTSRFKAMYLMLDSDARKGVIEEIYRSGKENPSIDNYLLEADNELVTEVGRELMQQKRNNC